MQTLLMRTVNHKTLFKHGFALYVECERWFNNNNDSTTLTTARSNSNNSYNDDEQAKKYNQLKQHLQHTI